MLFFVRRSAHTEHPRARLVPTYSCEFLCGRRRLDPHPLNLSCTPARAHHLHEVRGRCVMRLLNASILSPAGEGMSDLRLAGKAVAKSLALYSRRPALHTGGHVRCERGRSLGRPGLATASPGHQPAEWPSTLLSSMAGPRNRGLCRSHVRPGGQASTA